MKRDENNQALDLMSAVSFVCVILVSIAFALMTVFGLPLNF